MQQNGTTKLSEAELGIFTVMSVGLTLDSHVLRLCQMGLVPGQCIQLLRKTKNGSPFLVKVNHVVLCLDNDLAHHFVLRPVDP